MPMIVSMILPVFSLDNLCTLPYRMMAKYLFNNIGTLERITIIVINFSWPGALWRNRTSYVRMEFIQFQVTL